MFLYSVIPLTKIPRPQPQVVSYFSASDLVRGQLVEVPLGKRTVVGIIVAKLNAQEQKQAIRTSAYTLKNVKRPLSASAALPPALIKEAVLAARYYYEPLGLVLARALPEAFSKPTKPFIAQLNSLTLRPAEKRTAPRPTLLVSSSREELLKALKRASSSLLLQGPSPERAREDVAIYDSSLTPSQRRSLWLQAAAGTVQRIHGTRGALFLPMAHPDVLAIDGENTTSLVSWDQHPRIDARRVALMRAAEESYRILMRDSIPSVQTWHRATQEGWKIVRNEEQLAPVTLIDMRKELAQANTSLLSSQLLQALQALRTGEQAFLFMHRRGGASAILCRDCGYILRCSVCELAFVQHGRTLLCHHCGARKTAPHRCPACEGSRLKQIGGGTELLEQEVRRLAPGLRVLRIDSDIALSPKERDARLSAFAQQEADVLIGTNMAVREDQLPPLACSAIVMMDGIINLPFYRAAEEAFATLWRLRIHSKQQVYVQTYLPELPLFSQASEGSFDSFFQGQLAIRSVLKWPPFSHIIHLVYSHRNAETAQRQAEVIQKKLEEKAKHISAQAEIIGPAPALGPGRRGAYRWYILIKWPVNEVGDPANLDKRNELLSVVGSDWDITVDPIDIP